jgi:hypothetical protein
MCARLSQVGASSRKRFARLVLNGRLSFVDKKVGTHFVMPHKRFAIDLISLVFAITNAHITHRLKRIS